MCCSLKSEFRWGEGESHDPTLKRRQRKTRARPCVDWYAVAPIFTFESRSLTSAWRNSDRTPAGGARIAQQRPNRGKFVHACFADAPYAGGRDLIFARSGQ